MHNERLKILLIGRALKRQGGVNNYINLLLKHLNKNKFKVERFTQGKSPVKWKNIFLPFILTSQLFEYIIVLKDYKPDVVHINPSLNRNAIIRDSIYLYIAKKMGFKVLFFIHGWDEKISEKFKKEGFWRRFFRKKFKLADAIIVSASQFKEELVKLGIEPQKVFVSSTMVESEFFCSESKLFNPPHQILFCSTMLREKGPYELLRAIPLVLKKIPNTTFKFIGSGCELEDLKRMSNELGIESKTIFTGYISSTEKIKKFKKAHIFVFPSYTEGFPNVILEAMAAGMPLVSTPVGGLADALKDGKHGLIIKSMPPQPKEIADKIIKLIGDPEFMEEMSENNLKEVKEKYDVKVVTRNIGNLYSYLEEKSEISK